MKRVLASTLIFGVALVFTGCGEESKVESKEKVSSPTGTTETTDTHKVDSSGSNPPANTAGEKAESK